MVASGNNFEILKVLVEGGAKLNVRDGFEQPPLSLAEDNKNQYMVNYIKEKAEVESSKSSGLTK